MKAFTIIYNMTPMTSSLIIYICFVNKIRQIFVNKGPARCNGAYTRAVSPNGPVQSLIHPFLSNFRSLAEEWVETRGNICHWGRRLSLLAHLATSLNLTVSHIPRKVKITLLFYTSNSSKWHLTQTQKQWYIWAIIYMCMQFHFILRNSLYYIWLISDI